MKGGEKMVNTKEDEKKDFMDTTWFLVIVVAVGGVLSKVF